MSIDLEAAKASVLAAARAAGRKAGRAHRESGVTPKPPGSITSGSLLARRAASQWYQGLAEGRRGAVVQAHANDGEAVELAGAFNAALHPRVPAGSAGGGRFGSAAGGASRTAPAAKPKSAPAKAKPAPAKAAAKQAATQTAAMLKANRAKAAQLHAEANADRARAKALLGQISKINAQIKANQAAAAKAAASAKAKGHVAGTAAGKAVKKTAPAKNAKKKNAAKKKVTTAQLKARRTSLRTQVTGLMAKAKALDAQASHLKLANDGGRVLEFVGPAGYEHGWIYLGPQAVGAKVFHPQHGHGTVTAHDGTHATVKFDKSGVSKSFEAKAGKPGAVGKLTPSTTEGDVSKQVHDEVAAERAAAGDANARTLLHQMRVNQAKRVTAADKDGLPGLVKVSGGPSGMVAVDHNGAEHKISLKDGTVTVSTAKGVRSGPALEDPTRTARMLAGSIAGTSRVVGTTRTGKPIRLGDTVAVRAHGGTGLHDTFKAGGSGMVYSAPDREHIHVMTGKKNGYIAAKAQHIVHKQGGVAMAGDATAVELAMPSRSYRVRGAADVMCKRTAPGEVTVTHKPTGMKIGTLKPAQHGGWHGTHATGKATPASGSMAGALSGLIGAHNKLMASMPSAEPAGSVHAMAAHEAALEMAGTPAVTSGDGPRMTAVAGSKPAATALSPAAQAVYRKLIAKGMKPAQALSLAKRAAAMHAKAA